MIHYYSASMAGPYHIDNNIPCQDSRYIKQRDDGTTVAACTDGLGSEFFSDIGAQLGAYISVSYCAEHYDPDMSTDEVLHLIKVSFINAYKAVLKKAEEMGEDIDQFDSTLCLVIYDGENVWYGQSGDSGMVVRLTNGMYYPITEQQRDNDGNVFPLCSGPDYWMFGKVEGSVSSVMLMTDGVWEQICHPLLRKESVKVNTSLIAPFMERTETDQDEIDGVQKACEGFLENFPRDQLDDDKTVVILYNTDNPATKMPVEYYLYPDWDRLKEKNREIFYGDAPQEQISISTGAVDAPLRTNDNPVEDAPPVPAEQVEAAAPSEDESSDDEDSHSQSETKPPTRRRKREGKYQKGRKARPHDEAKRKKTVEKKKTPAKVLDIVSILIIVAFSLLAFLMRDVVPKYAPVSYFGVLLVCFIANASVLLPAPSILVVVQYSMILNPMLTALCGAIGATLGEMTGYLAGAHGGNLLALKIRKKVLSVMPKHPYLVVFCFSLIPLPVFDIVGLIAGAMKLNQAKFFGSCLIGKLIKMASFAWMVNYILKLLN